MAVRGHPASSWTHEALWLDTSLNVHTSKLALNTSNFAKLKAFANDPRGHCNGELEGVHSVVPCRIWWGHLEPWFQFQGGKKDSELLGCVRIKLPSPPPVSFFTLTLLAHSHQFWHQMCGVFTTPSNSLWHHWGVPQFNSILTLSAWRYHPIPKIKGSVPWNCPPPPLLQMPIKS